MAAEVITTDGAAAIITAGDIITIGENIDAISGFFDNKTPTDNAVAGFLRMASTMLR
jgi:hypothetical protein